MSGCLHVYTAKDQPAANYVVDLGFARHRFRNSPNKLLTCRNCGERRRVANLRVQVFYDCMMFYCKPGAGCKKAKKK